MDDLSDLAELPISHAQKAFVVRDGAVLAVQRSMGDLDYAGQWDLPGGHMEQGETEEEALKREVWEETSLTVAVAPEPFAETEFVHPPKKPRTRLQIDARLAICEDAAATPNLNNLAESDHISKVEWVPFDQLQQRKWIAALRPVIDAFIATYVTEPAAESERERA